MKVLGNLRSMKTFVILSSGMIGVLLSFVSLNSQASKVDSVYQMSVQDIDGKSVLLSKLSGKATLVVNVASRCGYTSQYKELEELYQKFKSKGLVVMGFPSNDFGGQEPGSNSEIKKFCALNYGVSFPMFSKGPVSGSGAQPVFKLLTSSSKQDPGEVQWNFEKFLVNAKGQTVARFRSHVKPSSAEMIQQIEKLLNESK
jgi:glutathione peroxidase